MKCLTLFLHAQAADDAIDCLRGLTELHGFTLTRCEGHSASSESDWALASIDFVVGYVPRVRIEVILEPEHLANVLGTLRTALAGGDSQGIYTVTQVEDLGRL